MAFYTDIMVKYVFHHLDKELSEKFTSLKIEILIVMELAKSL